MAALKFSLKSYLQQRIKLGDAMTAVPARRKSFLYCCGPFFATIASSDKNTE